MPTSVDGALASESQQKPASDSVSGEPTKHLKKRDEKSMEGIKLSEIGPRYVVTRCAAVPRARVSIVAVKCFPRFSLKVYRIELGTLDMKDLQVEWSLKPYFNKPKPALTSA